MFSTSRPVEKYTIAEEMLTSKDTNSEFLQTCWGQDRALASLGLAVSYGQGRESEGSFKKSRHADWCWIATRSESREAKINQPMGQASLIDLACGIASSASLAGNTAPAFRTRRF